MLAFLIALISYLGFALLGGLVCLIVFRSSTGSRSHIRLRSTFFLLVLCLLLWQVTLALAARTMSPGALLYLGRANFAAIACAVYLALHFVLQVARRKVAAWLSVLLGLEMGLLVVVTMFTPLISEQEWVDAGSGSVTAHYGLLFPLYLAHVLSYVLATLGVSFHGRHGGSPTARKQLTLIGIGILATSSVGLITNVVLPYGFGDFGFCSVGTLTTLLFVGAVAYSVFVHGLFDLRVVVRETLVYGVLLAFVLGAYSSTVFLLTQYLTDGADKMTQFGVLLIAFSVDPLRRFLEKKTDRLLFGRGKSQREQ